MAGSIGVLFIFLALADLPRAYPARKIQYKNGA